jgi:hypothetical protein
VLRFWWRVRFAILMGEYVRLRQAWSMSAEAWESSHQWEGINETPAEAVQIELSYWEE